MFSKAFLLEYFSTRSNVANIAADIELNHNIASDVGINGTSVKREDYPTVGELQNTFLRISLYFHNVRLRLLIGAALLSPTLDT